MKKRIVALFAAVCLLVVFFCGCKAENPQGIQEYHLPGDKVDYLELTDPRSADLDTSDIVIPAYEARFLWRTDDGENQQVNVSLPRIAGNGTYAEEYNSKVVRYGNALIEDIVDAAEEKRDINTCEVSYEFYTAENLLSILITEEYVNGEKDYVVDTIDFSTGMLVSTPALCDLLLEVDYPSFLDISNQLIVEEYIDSYNADMGEATEEWLEAYNETMRMIPMDTYNLYTRTLFLMDNTGRVGLVYQKPLVTQDWWYRVETHECIMPVETGSTEWGDLSTEKSYQQLFLCEFSERGYYSEYYSYLLQDAFLADPDEFVDRLSELKEESVERVLGYFSYALYEEIKEQVGMECQNLLQQGNANLKQCEIIMQLLNG